MKKRLGRTLAGFIAAVMLLSGTVTAYGGSASGNESLSYDGEALSVSGESLPYDGEDFSESRDRAEAKTGPGSDPEKGDPEKVSVAVDSAEGDEPVILKDDGSWKCGEFLNGTYTESDKTLKITGKGKMFDWDKDGSNHGEGFNYYEYLYRNNSSSYNDNSKYHYDNYYSSSDTNNYYSYREDYYYYYAAPWINDTASTLDFSCPNMTRIGNRAFYTMEGLTADVEISSDVTEIGSQAFEDTKITSVKFNDKLQKIEARAFKNCKSLAGDLTIPDKVTTIDSEAFYGESALNGRLSLGSALNSIGSNAFSDSGFTGALTIPKSVTSIGEGAFNNDTGLTGSLTFENGISLETIPKDAFRGCGFTDELAIPSSVRTIGDSAFKANSITKVYIPKETEEIAENAFDDCSSITEVIYGGTSGEWYTNGFDKLACLNGDGITLSFQGGDKVTVSFDSAGGSKVDKQTVPYNSLLTKPEDPERERCEFVAWYTGENNSGSEWDFTKDKALKNFTLYAAWHRLKCLVTFNSNGGSRVSSQTIDFNSTVTKPADPKKEGNEFLGWFTDEACLNEWDFDEEALDDMVLYAKWSGSGEGGGGSGEGGDDRNTYTISVTHNKGGNVTPAGEVGVFEHDDQTFTITPDEGYRIEDVKVDGESVGAVSNYTFHDITKDHTINATFTYVSGGGSEEGGGAETGTEYTITSSAGEGGNISPSGSLTVKEGESVTFTITPDEGFIVGNLLVDGRSLGSRNSYTFNSVTQNHEIKVEFISTDSGLRVHFETYEADEEIADQFVKSGGFVVRPLDPVKEGYEFKGWFKEPTFDTVWDFAKDVVVSETTLYAYYVATSFSSTDIYIKSSTGMFGKWVETEIGQGCTVKLFLANSDGAKMKNIKKKDITWEIKPYYNDGTKATDYFKLKNGKLKCNKDAPLKYTAMVTAAYNGNKVYYVVEIIKKIKKMGYYDGSGKFRKSLTVKVSPGQYCDFGLGPHHYLGGSDQYVCYYDASNAKTGTALYEQPDGDAWYTRYHYPKGEVYYCSAKLPKKAGVSIRSYSSGYWFGDVYYFIARKGSYKVKYLAPDGSGKSFTLIFKVVKKH